MIREIKETWRRLRQSQPGQRFQEYHRRRQKAHEAGWQKPLWMGLGLALFIAGLVFLVIPGPGIPIVIIGAGLLAREWGAAATLLDATELRMRRVWAWSVRRWQGSPAWARVLGALAALGVAGAALMGAYALVSSG